MLFKKSGKWHDIGNTEEPDDTKGLVASIGRAFKRLLKKDPKFRAFIEKGNMFTKRKAVKRK